MTNVLIIEDEKELANVLGDYFEMEGFQVDIANDGEEGLEKFYDKAPDFVILDIMLPKLNGIEVCKLMRAESEVVIVMLSAKDGEMDKVISLGAGADDYMTKPFSPLELMARVKAHRRRYYKKNESEESDRKVLKIGKICINPSAYDVKINGEKLEFTTKEFEMLLFFCTHLNFVFSKEQLYNGIWGSNEYGDIGTVAVYIKRLRLKLENYKLDYIKTIWGAGYKMTIEE